MRRSGFDPRAIHRTDRPIADLFAVLPDSPGGRENLIYWKGIIMDINYGRSTGLNEAFGAARADPLSLQVERSAVLAREWSELDAKGGDALRRVLGECLAFFRKALSDSEGFERLLKEQHVRITKRAGNRIATGVIRLAFGEIPQSARGRVRANQSTWASCVQGLHTSLPTSAGSADATAFLSQAGTGVKETARAFRMSRRSAAQKSDEGNNGGRTEIDEFLASGMELAKLPNALRDWEHEAFPYLVLVGGGRYHDLNLGEAEIRTIVRRQQP